MTKLDFQDKAVADLIAKFKGLWDAGGSMLPLVFKSPTGSGKTFMTESFIQELKSVGGFDKDVAWIWITFSDELAMQSKATFEEYFYPNVGRRLLTTADFSDGMLKRDDILFLNWQKLVANDADARILRRPDNPAKKKESGCYFEDIIEATHKEGRTIVMKKAELTLPLADGVETVAVHNAMTTDYVSRADYGDLGKASIFQSSFVASMDKWFGLSDGDFEGDRSAKVAAKGVSLTMTSKKSIVTGLKINSVDDNGEDGADMEEEVPRHDVEMLFAAKCREILEGQTDEETRVGNIARSDSIFRMGVRS